MSDVGAMRSSYSRERMVLKAYTHNRDCLPEMGGGQKDKPESDRGRRIHGDEVGEDMVRVTWPEKPAAT
jgi:hypothetical protein